MGVPGHLTCLLRNLYVGQEATVRTGRGITDSFQIGKGVWQGCILSSYLFNIHAQYIRQNARMDELQAGIKTARRNINNSGMQMIPPLWQAESKEKLKSILMKVKEESEEAVLTLNIQQTKIMASGSITSWQIHSEAMQTVTDFIFLGSKIIEDGDCSHEIKRHLLLGRKAMTNLGSVQHTKKQRDHFANKGPHSQSYSFSSSPVWM